MPATLTSLHGSLPYKPRVDTRTRAEQIKKQDDAWAELLPQAVDAYLAWKHGDSERDQPDDARNEPTGARAQSRASDVADAADDLRNGGMDVVRDDETERASRPPDIPPMPPGSDWFTVAAIRDTGAC